MEPERMRDLARQAEEIGRLARDLAAAAPSSAEGSDGTGWVHVVLGPQGAPAEIRVREGWSQRLEAHALAAAVVEANADAVRGAMRKWSDALEDGGSREDAAGPELPYGRERDSNDLAEEVIAALQAARTVAEEPSPGDVEGRDDSGHVTLRVGPAGLTACVVDADWARNRDGASLSAALSTAARRAAAAQPTAAPASPNDLVGDALATLTALTRPTPIEGGDNR